jgi:SAM-dependent methyltransferase
VTVIDLETQLLEPLAALGGVEVRRLDLASAELPRDAFDLVHGRNVLAHLPAREAVLGRLIEAVKPGGWLVVEEPDLSSDGPDPRAAPERGELYLRVTRAIYGFLRRQGLDVELGARLPGLVQRSGVEVVLAEARARIFRGGQLPLRSPHVAAFEQLRPRLVGEGTVSAADLDAFLALTDEPAFFWREAMTVAVCGRRPGGGRA